MICHYLGSGGDGEHKRGHSGTAEVQQATLQRKEMRFKDRIYLALYLRG